MPWRRIQYDEKDRRGGWTCALQRLGGPDHRQPYWLDDDCSHENPMNENHQTRYCASWVHEEGRTPYRRLCQKHYEKEVLSKLPETPTVQLEIVAVIPEPLSEIIARAIEQAKTEGQVGIARRLEVELELYGESHRAELLLLCEPFKRESA